MNGLKQTPKKLSKVRSIAKQILFWALVSGNLLMAYFDGLFYSDFQSISNWILLLISIPTMLAINYVFIQLYSTESKISIKERIFIWLYYAVTLLFAFLIGLSISQMQSLYRNNYALMMLPLLIVLNYIILRRLNFYMNTPFDKNTVRQEEDSETEEKKKERKRPVIEFEGKKYSFSINSLVILAIGAPLVTFLVYYLFDWKVNYWLHEIVVKQTVFTMNLLFDMGMSYNYIPSQHNPWAFIVPGKSAIGFETFCTGVQAICVFAGIILLTPHSKDKVTNRDIIWRKAKSLIISSAIFYIVNILRMVIQLYLYYIGYPWSDIHYSISAASSFIAAIIVLLMHKYIPEFIISLIWTYTLIKSKIKALSKKEKNSVSK